MAMKATVTGTAIKLYQGFVNIDRGVAPPPIKTHKAIYRRYTHITNKNCN